MAEGIASEFHPPQESESKLGEQHRLKNILDKITRRFKQPVVEKVEEVLVETHDTYLTFEEILKKENEEKEKMFLENLKKQREQEEREKLEQDLVTTMDKYRDRKVSMAKSERVQEISESSFNEKLTKLENIKLLAEAGDNEVSKREIQFEGKVIDVYDLKGLPFSFLKHAIDFKGRGKDLSTTGAITAKLLQDDPSFWAKPEDKNETYDSENSDRKSNTISTSYINMEEISNLYGEGLLYGFDHVEPDSILFISTDDGGTLGGSGNNRTYLKQRDKYTPEMLEDPINNSSVKPYNEILLRRYDEKGQPKLPDYVVVFDDNVSDIILKHAAYFGIPVINIETEIYIEKENTKLLGLIDSIDEKSTYKDITNVLNRLNFSYLTDQRIGLMPIGIGLDNRNNHYLGNNEELRRKIEIFSNFELAKRVELIKKRLQEETDNINQSTLRNESYYPLSHGINEVRKIDISEDPYISDDIKSANATHCLEIDIEVQEGQHEQKIEIYDGKRQSPDNKLRDYGEANSVYYNELESSVNAYISALNTNKESIESAARKSRQNKVA